MAHSEDWTADEVMAIVDAETRKLRRDKLRDIGPVHLNGKHCFRKFGVGYDRAQSLRNQQNSLVPVDEKHGEGIKKARPSGRAQSSLISGENVID